MKNKYARSRYIDFLAFVILAIILFTIGAATKRFMVDVAGAVMLFFALDAFISVQLNAAKKKKRGDDKRGSIHG